MGHGDLNLRTVVLDRAAEQVVNSLEHGIETPAYRALEWLLSRKPDTGLHIKLDPDRFLYVQAPDSLARTQGFWVVYSFTHERVVFHGLKVIEAEED